MSENEELIEEDKEDSKEVYSKGCANGLAHLVNLLISWGIVHYAYQFILRAKYPQLPFFNWGEGIVLIFALDALRSVIFPSESETQ